MVIWFLYEGRKKNNNMNEKNCDAMKKEKNAYKNKYKRNKKRVHGRIEPNEKKRGRKQK